MSYQFLAFAQTEYCIESQSADWKSCMAVVVVSFLILNNCLLFSLCWESGKLKTFPCLFIGQKRVTKTWKMGRKGNKKAWNVSHPCQFNNGADVAWALCVPSQVKTFEQTDCYGLKKNEQSLSAFSSISPFFLSPTFISSIVKITTNWEKRGKFWQLKLNHQSFIYCDDNLLSFFPLSEHWWLSIL